MTAPTETKIESAVVIKRGIHADTVRCACGAEFLRAKRETYGTCLSCQTAQRLAAAGFTHDDPALTRIRDHNARAAHWNLPSHVRHVAENAARSDRAAAVREVVTR